MMATNDTAAITVVFTAQTLAPPIQPLPMFWGFIGVALASILFGSNLIPIKKFQTGDGVFFQWVLCSAIWTTGLVLNAIRKFPQFYPLAMLGGFLWCTGNIMVVPILKTVGLSQGMLIWAALNMLSGWASGRFGLFGLTAQIPPYEALNYVGVSLCLVSAIVYMFLKTSNMPEPVVLTVQREEDNPVLDTDASVNGPADTKPEHSTDAETAADNDDDDDGDISKAESRQLSRTASRQLSRAASHQLIFYERLSPTAQRILGIAMAVTAGLLFGLNFTPVIYIQQNPDKYPSASASGLDYVFAHFTGILLTSTVYLLIYSAFMRNKPRVYPKVILPGFVSGVMWGVADIGWFVANDTLSQPVSFPIITSFPALIGAFWGIVLFHEIRGRRNYIILLIAIVLAVSGSVLTGLSKLERSHDANSTAVTTAAVTTPSSPTTTHAVY